MGYQGGGGGYDRGPREMHKAVCSECKKKVVSGAEGFVCGEHGKIPAEKRALINLVIDDGTETIRAVVFNENLPGLGFNDLENIESMIIQRNSLLGKEMIFSGNVKMNKFFNNPELIIDKADEIDLNSLIKEMES